MVFQLLDICDRVKTSGYLPTPHSLPGRTPKPGPCNKTQLNEALPCLRDKKKMYGIFINLPIQLEESSVSLDVSSGCNKQEANCPA